MAYHAHDMFDVSARPLIRGIAKGDNHGIQNLFHGLIITLASAMLRIKGQADISTIYEEGALANSV